MALAYRGTPTTGTVHGGSAVTVNAPAGLTSGDLVMIAVFGDSRVASNPSGFGAAQRSTSHVGTLFYSKVAGGSEPASYTISFSVNVIAVAACVAVSGQNSTWNDPTTLPAIFDPGATSTSCAVPGITLAGATDWLIGFFGFGQNVAPGTFSLPAGFTSRVAEFTSGAAASDIGMIAGDVQSIGSGATGTKTATTTGSANYPVGFIVGVTPGTGGGTVVPLPTATATATATAVIPVTGALVTGSDLFPLPVTVELLLAGTWTDITGHVYQRDGIQISGGRTQVSDTSQPAQATLTLNNRDGRFSPNYSGGTYFPYLQRNVQIRIAVNGAVSSSGNTYGGYRFWGEVSEWPPLSDLSGNDVYVPITASGPLRRIRKGGGKGSALTRYYNTLTGAQAPVAYWPCEEDPDTSIIGAGIEGGTNMTVTFGTPRWKANNSFNGSAPVGVLNGSTWDGLTSSFGTSGDDIFSSPGLYQWVASVSSVDARVVDSGGGGVKGQAGAAVGGPGGGGGAFTRNAAVAVTVGQTYQLFVAPGGSPGLWNVGGSPGQLSWFTGDAVTVTGTTPAGGGGPGPTSAGGAAGTGGHNGGAGGGHPGSSNAGAGGGSSGGLSAAGNNGGAASGSTPGSGGAAPAGGGRGGDGGSIPSGGSRPSPPSDGDIGSQPGAGGGGGWASQSDHTNGGAGAPGRIELIYTPATSPNNNVIRFLMQTPTWGGNSSKVLLRALTAGTVHQLDVQFDSTAKKLVLKGYNSVGGLLFTGNLGSNIAGQTLLVSAELAASGSSVAWRLACVKPGGTADFDSVSGTQTSATMGSVTEVIAAPNADITKTAVGHISVQYAFIGLQKVSKALAGHDTETGVDRFVRLAGEQALGNAVEFNEGNDHWGFGSSTMGWTASNCSITQSSVTATGWPTQGSTSLRLSATGGAGTWSATSPAGTSGQPVQPGDIVSAAADVYAPATTLNAVALSVNYYNGPGALLSTATGPSQVLTAGTVTTLNVGKSNGSTAPTGAATFSVTVSDAETVAASTLLYVDHVRVHPQMGVQTRKEYHKFLEEIEDLDQGIMKEAKELWGLKYRTRIRLINQSPALTLDYNQGEISPPLAPVLDDQNLKNNITVKRHKGSKVQVTLASGQMSILEPAKGGSGQYKKHLKVAAAADEQLAALAAHLLLLGTVPDERYPTVTVDLARAGAPGNALAPLMSAVAGAEIGDMLQLVNLPFWFPSTSTQQMIIGYTEQINANPGSGQPGWTVTWNCTPYVPYVQVTSQIRRW